MREKVIFITGAESGIGKATAQMFAQAGGSVMLTGLRDNLLREVAEDLRSKGHSVAWCVCDVTNEQQIKTAINETVKAFGRIDYAFNNAGVCTMRFD